MDINAVNNRKIAGMLTVLLIKQLLVVNLNYSKDIATSSFNYSSLSLGKILLISGRDHVNNCRIRFSLLRHTQHFR